MTNEQNKAIARRFYEAFQANDQAALKDVLAPDFVAHHHGSPGPLNREALLQGISMFNSAFTGLQISIEDIVAEGDRVVTRGNWRFTHSGDFQGIPPTGKEIAISGIAIDRIKDGKIVERWLNDDQLSLMQQLGLIPAPGEG